jgi:predicted hydrocarbon binding protein
MEVYHSVFAEAFGSAGAPVCHMIRGVFAGTWEGALDRNVNGLETRCRASDGPGPCKFIFSASSEKRLDVSYTTE